KVWEDLLKRVPLDRGIDPADERHAFQQVFPDLDYTPAHDVRGEHTGEQDEHEQQENADTRHISFRHVPGGNITEQTINGQEKSLEDKNGPPDGNNHQETRDKITL